MGVAATICGILRNPRWLPFHWNGYNILPVRHRCFIFASIPMFYGSSNSLNVFLILPNYDITRKSNMATKMAAVRSATRIRFIVILESYFLCLFHGSVLLIMALSGQSVWGNGEYTCGLSIKWCPLSLLLYIETTFIRYGHGPGGIFGIMLNEHALWHWTSIIVRDWQRTLLTWKSHLIRSRPPQRRVPFNNKDRRWWLVCYQRQAGDVWSATKM